MALSAWRAGALTGRGAVAAVVVGTATTLAGWSWALLLVGWFVASSALTRWGRAAKRARTARVLADERGRKALQVASNGGLFALCAVASVLVPDPRWSLAAIGALAAAAADTWATELGLLWGGRPRHLFTLTPIEPGTSGGVTVTGSLASLAGAAAVSHGGAVLGVLDAEVTHRTLLALTAAGVLGALADSILGASVQARRYCATCNSWTERSIHDCGASTQHARGLRWMTNDTVNFLATAVGAVAALLLA